EHASVEFCGDAVRVVIAAADVRPQRSPHCEQTAVIIGPLRNFTCPLAGAQSGHAPAIAFNHDLRTPAFGSLTCKNVTVIDFQRSMLLRREPAGPPRRWVDGGFRHGLGRTETAGPRRMQVRRGLL